MASNSLMWTLVDGNILTVELNYLVFNRTHKVQFFFVVKTEGIKKASPLTVTTFFRNYFLAQIFRDVCSQELIWESTKVTHLEGSLKLPEDAQTANTELETSGEPIDMENRLRVSFVRYNRNTPIFFYLYGIGENLEISKMASALLKMTQEDLNMEGEGVGFRFAGLTSPNQVTENNFVVSISCKKQPIPKKQAYNKEEYEKNIKMTKLFIKLKKTN